MIGNVWEITSDCFVLNLGGIPRDGSPRAVEAPSRAAGARVAFDIFTYWGRVGHRSLYDTVGNPRFSYEGFRVARTLE